MNALKILQKYLIAAKTTSFYFLNLIKHKILQMMNTTIIFNNETKKKFLI